MIEKAKVGKMIATQRKVRNMTQRQLAGVLHVSYQAVSKWEAGLSLPTVEMIYDIALVLDVTVDSLLNGTVLEHRDICYKDTGLDTVKLYALKDRMQELLTKDTNLLCSNYIEPVFYHMDTKCMKEPVYTLTTNNPGSKARFARMRGYDKEICEDLVAKSINNIIRFGVNPVVLKAHLVCGNKDHDQIWAMAETLKKSCEDNDVIYAGTEVAAQPINYLPSEYELSVSLTGVADRSQIITGEKILEGDCIIGLLSQGLESTCFPFIHVMLDRNPGLAYEKIDSQHFFMDEILKPNASYASAVKALLEAELIHGIINYSNSVLNRALYYRLPEGLGARVNLSAIPVKHLYRFMESLDMVGRKSFQYRFSFGIGMGIVVSEKKCKRAMELIAPFHKCFVLGRIEKDTKHPKEYVWTEGEIQW